MRGRAVSQLAEARCCRKCESVPVAVGTFNTRGGCRHLQKHSRRSGKPRSLTSPEGGVDTLKGAVGRVDALQNKAGAVVAQAGGVHAADREGHRRCRA